MLRVCNRVGRQGASQQSRSGVEKRKYASDAFSNDKSRVYDATQIELMKEKCILVNELDEPLGPVSKEECHKVANINDGKALHRAFR
mmetsp:Transcript_15212/g.16915  ORF Transcript_15212/g.16915 Transcript_15212/m.16915 type:complete len:87 (+) Transcript_15212:43-303(+)